MQRKSRLLLLATPVIFIFALFFNWNDDLTGTIAGAVEKTLLWSFLAWTILVIDHFFERGHTKVTSTITSLTKTKLIVLGITWVGYITASTFMRTPADSLTENFQNIISNTAYNTILAFFALYAFYLMPVKWRKGFFFLIPLMALYLPTGFWRLDLSGVLARIDTFFITYTFAYASVFYLYYFYKEIREESARMHQERLNQASTQQGNAKQNPVEDMELAAYNVLLRHSHTVFNNLQGMIQRV